MIMTATASFLTASSLILPTSTMPESSTTMCELNDSNVSGTYRYLMKHSTPLDGSANILAYRPKADIHACKGTHNHIDSCDDGLDHTITRSDTTTTQLEDSLPGGVLLCDSEYVGKTIYTEKDAALLFGRSCTTVFSKDQTQQNIDGPTSLHRSRSWAAAPIFIPRSASSPDLVQPGPMPLSLGGPLVQDYNPKHWLMRDPPSGGTSMNEASKLGLPQPVLQQNHSTAPCSKLLPTTVGPMSRGSHGPTTTNPQPHIGSPPKQKSYLEIFRFIQSKLGQLVRTISFAGIDSCSRDIEVAKFITRCVGHIEDRQAALWVLRQQQLRPAIIAGLIWRSAASLIFCESLIDQFPCNFNLAFTEAWAAEVKTRSRFEGTTRLDLLQTRIAERARVAQQIVRIPGFWKDWRKACADNIASEIVRSLTPVLTTSDSSYVLRALKDVVRPMVDVAIRMRQECKWYDLEFPAYNDKMTDNTMVGPIINHQASLTPILDGTVQLSQSPTVIERTLHGGKVLSNVLYKAEVLLQDNSVTGSSHSRRESW